MGLFSRSNAENEAHLSFCRAQKREEERRAGLIRQRAAAQERGDTAAEAQLQKQIRRSEEREFGV